MKKRIVFLLASTIFMTVLSSCVPKNIPSDDICFSVHVEGSIFSGKNDRSIGLTVKYNPDWLTVGDNTRYNGELASFAVLLSTDSYFREKDLAGGTQNRVLPDDAGNYTFTTLLSSLGFEDTQHIESYKEKKYESDANDSITLNLAHSVVADKYDVYVAAVRGCFSAGEWMSAFDAGTPSADGHPDWKNRDNLKGIDVAANRAYDLINEFISAHDDIEKPNHILITGHSRGGAISEVLGAMYEDDDEITSYTYAFNSMAVTTNPRAQDYKTIYNIFDSGDMYSDILPFGQERFYRYGKTLTEEIALSDDIINKICNLKGETDFASSSDEMRKEYASIFGKRFTDRSSLSESRILSEDFDDSVSADTRTAELNQLLGSESGLGLEGLCSVGNTEFDGKIRVTLQYDDAAALIAVGKVFTYGKPAADAVKSLFGGDEDLCSIVNFVSAHSAEMSGGHLLVNSYVLCGFFE